MANNSDELYSIDLKNAWDSFVENSKNGTFLFKRDYMDYHSERFKDHSVLVYRKGLLYTILPANLAGNVLYSHQGLTYGGYILSSKVTALELLDVFECVNLYLRAKGIKEVIYKTIPHIYHDILGFGHVYSHMRLLKY